MTFSIQKSIFSFLAILGLLFVMPAEAAGKRSQSKQLVVAQSKYFSAIRWNEFELAWTYVDPAYRTEHPLTDLDKERFKQIQVTGYEEMRQDVLAEGRCAVSAQWDVEDPGGEEGGVRDGCTSSSPAAAGFSAARSCANSSRAATEYALLSSLFALSGSVAGWLGGLGAQSMGYGNWFLLTFFLAAPAYLLLPWVRRMLDRGEAARERDVKPATGSP